MFITIDARRLLLKSTEKGYNISDAFDSYRCVDSCSTFDCKKLSSNLSFCLVGNDCLKHGLAVFMLDACFIVSN